MIAARKMLGKLFPEQRELIVRSGGQIRYLRVSRHVQVGSVTLVAAVLVWTAFSTVQFSSHNNILSARNDQISALQDQNARFARELAQVRDRVDIQRRSLTATQQTTVDLETSNRSLEDEVGALQAALDAQKQHGDALAFSYMGEVEAKARLAAETETLARSREELQQQLVERRHELASVEESRRALDAQLAESRGSLADLKSNVVSIEIARADLQASLDASNQRLHSAMGEKLAIDTKRQALGEQVADLSARLESLETAQLGIVSRLGETADQSGEALRKTLDLAGLDVDRLLDRMARAAGEGRGVGGPLLAIDGDAIERSPGAGLALQLATVERRIDDLQSLQSLMEHLPLAAPLDEFRVTSNFGRRVDPFTKRLAFHSGVDLASRRRAPVRVTSPGIITFVGWKGGFGKMVEVDHGLGVRTRYGHLSAIFVKRGQEVDFREKLGLVGSTGRSSGEHLHYEILVDGRQNDPSNFIKAGQYVFKN
ncbi:MAG: peptidoglycan DD-metalloendopeptidase family protein [Proteobacteria bacterium]|nr:peptidoglycan DD-metalloendopeptidase family protein [Pseudomonadota bacterium]